MQLINLRNKREVTLRSASGVLSAGETSPEVQTSKYRAAVLDLDVAALTTPDADDEVDFYFQTKINGRWQDFANVHFVQADNGSTPKRTVLIGPPKEGVAAAINPTDGTIADNTVSANMPLGEALRVKTAVTGATAPSYNYSVKVSLLG